MNRYYLYGIGEVTYFASEVFAESDQRAAEIAQSVKETTLLALTHWDLIVLGRRPQGEYQMSLRKSGTPVDPNWTEGTGEVNIWGNCDPYHYHEMVTGITREEEMQKAPIEAELAKFLR